VKKPNVGKIENFTDGILREYDIQRKNDKLECRILYRNFGKDALVNDIKLTQKSGEIVFEKELAPSVIFEWKINAKIIFDTVFTADLFVKERSVVITEVASRASDEWIEIYWKDECFPLENWYLIVGESVVALPKIDCPKNKILCISEKESGDLINMIKVANWRKINNYSDTIFLFAPFGVVDSVAWTSDIFANSSDKSTVQRRDANKSGFDNDNIFAGKESPGAVLIYNEIKKFAINLSSKKFTPNGDKDLDSLVIFVEKPRNGTVKIEIYEMSGNIVKTFESATQTRFVWDGKTDTGLLAQIGPVFVVGTFDDKKTKTSDRKDAILWR
jgi:hypothetical protein